MVKLFAYGSLQNQSVQKSILGYSLSSSDIVETIWNYDLKDIIIDSNIYPMAYKKSGSRIHGIIIDISPKDIDIIDMWEGKNYIRVYEYTQSGILCQIYTERRN